jgi:benzodiazapine receptor
MQKDTVRQAANGLAVVATIVVNLLANALPLNGQTTGEISDRFRVYFVPAGYVFAIWGVIYIGLTAFAIYQALPAQRESANLRRAGYLVVLGCLANIAWIFLWHYERLALTLVAMAVLLLTLLALYLRLDIGRARVSQAEKWCVHIPFSIYLGWVTVATIANVTAFLWAQRWGGFGLSDPVWAVIMLAVGTLITATVVIHRKDIAYGLVIVWAFVGILVKHTATPVVAVSASLAAGVVALTIALTVRNALRLRPPVYGG